MSGIFGFIRKNEDPQLCRKALHALDVWNRDYGSSASKAELIEHSGIGCHIEHFSENFPLGGPILDFKGSNAVIDALIYNRDELLLELELPENSLVSDEELLLQWISAKGFDALAQVNGDFAGAIFDAEKQEWIIFRDQMGVRPVYYYLDEDQFAFSTDMRGLLALPGADTSPDELALYHRAMGYNDLSLCGTDYARIRCIHPAAWTVVSCAEQGFQITEHLYWRLKQKKIRFSSPEKYQQELRRLVTDAVKRRLDAIPGLIGAELSGGLDSGVVDILISRLGREARFFSWSWDTETIPLREDDDERKIIFDICKQEGINCEFTRQGAYKTIEENLSDVMPPYINTLNLSQGSEWLKSQGANVVFTGHGGDEGISHRCDVFEILYNREYAAYLKVFWDRTKGEKLRLLRTLKRAWIWAKNAPPAYTAPYENRFRNGRAILHESFKARMEPQKANTPLYFTYAPEKYVEQGGTRVRLDNVAYHGAINGVRYLLPFIDHRVMDFAVSIPRHLYVKGNVNRYIYREAFKDILPESLYKMQYKDTSSLRDFEFGEEIRQDFRKTMNSICSYLDREYWAGILDFDAIAKIDLPDDYKAKDYHRVSIARHELYRCLLIQNARDNAGKMCEEHD